MSQRDYEVLLGYVNRYISTTVLPALASKRRRAFLNIGHNPFSLSDACCMASATVSKTAILGHLEYLAQANLIEHTGHGFEYTGQAKVVSELAEDYAVELAAFRDSRSSEKKWEILSRLYGAQNPVSHTMLSQHTRFPESTLSRLVKELQSKGLVGFVKVGKNKLYRITERGQKFVDATVNIMNKIATHTLNKIVSAGPGKYSFPVEPHMPIELLEYDGNTIKLAPVPYLR
jgi:predicted transcriptional regulator